MNVNQIVRIIPTLKVNNRKLNETFYIETLGMKALLEESAFLSLGDQTG
ncbi:MAG: CppA N-terminal domain-containing protein, partial [Streptococcus mitis]|nr:CppA N-terminal domain-containing protein [Streptococcus mitis]